MFLNIFYMYLNKNKIKIRKIQIDKILPQICMTQNKYIDIKIIIVFYILAVPTHKLLIDQTVTI